MNLYVAGSSLELQRARAAMDAAQAAGYSIALDWVSDIEACGGVANEGHDDDTRGVIAQTCLHAVRHADLLWLLAPVERSAGCWGELIYAFASGTRIIASGPTKQTVFCALAEVELDTDAEALAWLVRWRAER